VQHNALKQLNQLVWQLGLNKRLNSDRDLVNISALRERRLDNLVNDLLAVGVLWIQHLRPQFLRLALDQVPRLHTVEVVLIRNSDELIIARAPSALVSSESVVWVALLTVLTNDL